MRAHAPSRLGAKTAADHLVVLPQGAVKQHDRRAGQTPLQGIADLCAARDVKQPVPICAHLNADRIARLAGKLVGRRACLDPERDFFPGHQTIRLKIRCRCHRRAKARMRGQCPGLATLAILGQHAKDPIGLQHVEHALAGVDRERLAFAQMQQPGDRIDIGAGENDAFDSARSARRGLGEGSRALRPAGEDRERR